jgi:hypothetical protein
MRRLRRNEATLGQIVWGVISYLVYCAVSLYNDWEIRRDARRKAAKESK